jgi:uncharacterized protein (DUF1501 family)
MLDPDISTADALRLLSTPGLDDRGDRRGPGGWSRRGFLQAIGAGVIGGAALGTLGEMLVPSDLRDAFAAAPIGPTDGILITLMLYGGNDGLNTVVPYGNGLYYSQRGNIAVPAAQVLPIDGQIGFHPRLPYLKSLYDQGQVAVVQGVGYPNPDLSHFTSMATWMSARYGTGAATSGWIGRWLDGLSPAAAELAVATIDSSVALHLQGNQRRAVAISPYGDMFGSTSSAPDLRMYAGLSNMASPAGRGQWHDMFATTMKTQVAMAQQVAPVFVQSLPSAELVKKMTVAARLINADIGLRVVDVSLDGFDTHDGQPNSHPDLLGQIDAALAAFYSTLSPTFRDRVTIMTMSEFGRTSYSNASNGTDHGTAGPMFVLGSQVRGGLYGQAPSLAVRDRWTRLQHTVDFRSVIGTVIDGWMGGGASTILGGTGENLGLFSTGPKPPTSPVVVLPTAAASGFVPTSPTRAFDTRDGTGGRRGALGPSEVWRFPLTGRFGVPTDAIAVAINVTAVDATEASFVTVFPSGEARPLSSNLNPVPGAATPNLVIARVGVGGSIDLYNNNGTVHLVGDVVGWFTTGSTVGMQPLPLARLLDTRDGTGGVLGALGPGQTADIQVIGAGGVPAGVTAVALNVTAVEPSAGSYLSIWPTGQPRPLASSVNMMPGQTVANMVLAQVGANGKVSVFNNSGSAHVVVDVLSAFTPGTGSRFVTISPSRVLDTREGNGALRARLGRGSIGVPLAGRGGVPARGVSAVLLNVTAVAPTALTYLTVFASDAPRPLASNLNASSGQVVPNMVIARLGADGAATIFNNDGDTDVVADVMGYFVG